MNQPSLTPLSALSYSGNFRGVQIFAFFEGRVVNAKIKTGINSHAPVYAGAKPIGGCGLLALTRKLKPRQTTFTTSDTLHIFVLSTDFVSVVFFKREGP